MNTRQKFLLYQIKKYEMPQGYQQVEKQHSELNSTGLNDVPNIQQAIQIKRKRNIFIGIIIITIIVLLLIIVPHPDPLHNYPNIGKRYNTNLTSQGLAQHGMQMETLLIAKQYLRLGLQEPSNELVLRQKFYYQKKYQLQANFRNTLNSLQFPFCILIPSFNNAKNKRYLLPLKTIFRQDYKNYHVVYIDDASTDNTGGLVDDFIVENKIPKQKILLIRNQKNKGSLRNQYQTALQHCGEDQIYMILDGDDGLLGTQTLKLFNHFYQTTDNWFIYGNYIGLFNQLPGLSNQIPKEVIQKRSYRKHTWITSHPKTFYNILLKKMSRSNLVDRDQNGKQTEFFRILADTAIIFPVVQMAGSRIKYIPQMLYIYFQFTQYSDSIVHAFQDIKALELLTNYPKQEKLECLFETTHSCPKANQYIKQKLKAKIESKN